MQKERQPEEIIESLDTLRDETFAQDLGLSGVDGLEDESAKTLKVQARLERRTSDEIDAERQKNQGKTDKKVESDADAWLRAAGFDKDGNPL